MAVSVLAVLALPMIGVGPMLMRTMRPAVFGVCAASCSGLVFVLTGAPWATAFTACLGAALMLRGMAARRRRPATIRAAYGDERSSVPR